MKNYRIIYFLILASFIFSSCEKVIDIDLNNANPRIVVEAQIADRTGLNLVSITRTSNFYSSDLPERVEGATVEITDDMGNNFVFEEIEPGFYHNKVLKSFENHTYNLQITTSDEIIEASSITASSVKIDSLKIESSEFHRGNGGEDNLHKVTCYFMDIPNEKNYYRLRIVVNGDYLSGFYIVDDEFFDGKTIPYSFSGISLYDNDIVWVELMGIDEANFKYYYTLARLDGNGQDITPGNPPSNIVGNAIGIFGSYTFDNKSEVFHVK